MASFSTVRELEKKSSKAFMYGGGGLFVGLVMVFFVAPLGIILMALSAIVLLGAICYVSMMGKEKSRPLYCPYCSSKNDVYLSVKEFDCDICKRPIKIDEFGQAVMAQEIDMTMLHNQKRR